MKKTWVTQHDVGRHIFRLPAFFSPGHFETLPQNRMNVTLCVLCGRTMIFWSALPADYGGINTEASALDMINRYELERANGAQTLLKVRLWDYNGVDMDYKMDEREREAYDGTCACARLWKARSYWIVRRHRSEQIHYSNGCIRVHAELDQGHGASKEALMLCFLLLFFPFLFIFNQPALGCCAWRGESGQFNLCWVVCVCRFHRLLTECIFNSEEEGVIREPILENRNCFNCSIGQSMYTSGAFPLLWTPPISTARWLILAQNTETLQEKKKTNKLKVHIYSIYTYI